MNYNHWNPKQNISKRFREFRINQGLTQLELSVSLKVDQSSISNIECSKCLPTIRIITDMMRIFSLSPNWLLSGEGKMTLNSPKLSCSVSDQEEIDELLFYLENVPPVRNFILKEFIVYRFRNQEKIKRFLERQNIKKI